MGNIPRPRILVITDRYPIDPLYSPSTWMHRSICELNTFADVQVISIINILPRFKNIFSFGRDWRWLKRSLLKNIDTKGSYTVPTKHYRVVGVPAKLSWWFLPRFIAIQCLKRIIADAELQKYDMLITHTTYPTGYVALKISRVLGIPFVVYNHDGWKIYKQYFGNNAAREVANILQSADAIMTLSNNHFVEINNNFPSQNIYYMPLGIDTVDNINRTENSKIFGVITASRLDGNEKKINILIDAFSIFIRNITNEALLTIAGDGNDLIHLKRQVARLGLNNNVKFVGWLSSDKLKLMMQENDIYVCSSDCETFNYAALEAASIGLPIVGLITVGVIKEFVSIYPNELALNQLDADSIYEKIKTLYRDESKRKEIGNKMKLKAKNEYSWDNHRTVIEKNVEMIMIIKTKCN